MDIRLLLNESPLSPRQSHNTSSSTGGRDGRGNRHSGSSNQRSPKPGPSDASGFHSWRTGTTFHQTHRGESSSSRIREQESRATELRAVDRHNEQPDPSRLPATSLQGYPRSDPVAGPSRVAPGRGATSSRHVAGQQPGSRGRPTTVDAAAASSSGPGAIKRLSREVAGRWAWFCSVCDKEFKSSGHCKTHINTVHLMKKDYVCGFCSMEFGQGGSLSRHIKNKHKNLRDHECPNSGCNKTFATRWSAKSHDEAVHQGLKPHACRSPHCTRRFSERWNRKKHEKSAHKLFIDSAEKPSLRRRSSVSAPGSAPAPAPAAAAGTLTHPAAVIESVRTRSTPRPRHHRSPNGVEHITPQPLLLIQSRLVAPPSTEQVTPHVPVPRMGSPGEIESVLNLLELGKSADERRNAGSAADANIGRSVPASVGLLLRASQGESVSPPQGFLSENLRRHSGLRRDSSKRSKSAGPVINKFGSLRGTGKDRTGNDSGSDATASSRHSRLRKSRK